MRQGYILPKFIQVIEEVFVYDLWICCTDEAGHPFQKSRKNKERAIRCSMGYISSRICGRFEKMGCVKVGERVSDDVSIVPEDY